MGAEQANEVRRFVLPPGYTQVPNVLLDEVLRDGSLAEIRVTLMIARRTFGFGLGERLLSNAELCELCNLSRQSVTDGLKAGEARGLIGKRNMGGNRWAYGIRVKNLGSQEASQLPRDQDVDSLAARKSSIPEKQTPPGGNKKAGADAPDVGKKGAIKGKPGATFKPNPDDEVHTAIVQIHQAWVEKTGRTKGHTLTVKRAQQIRARMREQAEGVDRDVALATARDRLLEGIEAWAGSSWHRERDAFGFDVFFRSHGKVLMFLERGPETAPSTNGSGDFAGYGGVVERG